MKVIWNGSNDVGNFVCLNFAVILSRNIIMTVTRLKKVIFRRRKKKDGQREEELITTSYTQARVIFKEEKERNSIS